MGVLTHKKPRGLFMGEDPPTGVGTHKKPARAQAGSGAENPLVTMWWKWQGYEEIANKAYSIIITIGEGAAEGRPLPYGYDNAVCRIGDFFVP